MGDASTVSLEASPTEKKKKKKRKQAEEMEGTEGATASASTEEIAEAGPEVRIFY